MKVMFMGTPDIAAAFLEETAKHYEVVCCVTQPDKPKGRGHKLHRCAAACLADSLGIDVVQPVTFKDNAFLPILEKYAPDIIAVVAYGRILPEYVLNFPKYGCINVHASLLPRHRGACPINKAIMDGDGVTGVTTMLMAKGLDTGDMLLKQEIPITGGMTAGQLHDIICRDCPPLLIKTIDNIENITPIPQNEAEATCTGMLNKENTKIDWGKPAAEVVNFINGLSPFPCAHTVCSGKGMKVFGAQVCGGSGKPGEILECDKRFVIACGSGAVMLTDVQLESKKRMSAGDLLRGFKPEKNEVLPN